MFRVFDALHQSPYADTALAEFIREPIVQGTTRAWTPPAPAAPDAAGRWP
ncbi:hypothetical protein [Streptomyces hirsutus]|nr:hypothetical protein [Streptomyces hirsutus]